MNSLTINFALTDILLHPNDLDLQKMYHDMLLDEGRNCLQESLTHVPTNIGTKHNNYFVNELSIKDIIGFEQYSYEMIKHLPITKIKVEIRPGHRGNTYYWCYANNPASVSNLGYNVIPIVIYNLMSSHLVENNRKIWYKEKQERACLDFYQSLQRIVLS
jgi:hypothetical protein